MLLACHSKLLSAPSPLQLNEGRVAAAVCPMAEREQAQVLDVVAAVDRQVERVHPDVVGELQLPRRRFSDHAGNTSFTCGAVRPLEENASDFTTTGTTLAGWMSSPTST